MQSNCYRYNDFFCLRCGDIDKVLIEASPFYETTRYFGSYLSEVSEVYQHDFFVIGVLVIPIMGGVQDILMYIYLIAITCMMIDSGDI
ncbi:conserved hypothetical protein [Vibrio chagasii]|nr:hypothetical protein BTO12_02615 [Vibrio splendidus]CAH7341205.1 conserved hypothetical protein [Vibrio chagasii]CAH7362504.1 conserved hypothetical protein [Vibrio chagasii]CAH7376433.1 conserved hypothetical protein [Vibrio chagasii]CAH7400835.1 conserved hypothetical protein [Vibrio chagasii]